MIKLPISEIVIFPRKRSLKDIEPLKESIKKLGLLNPITVNKHKVLVAGYHRFIACKELGWQEIPVTILSFDNLQAELAQIDENIIRKQLTALENAEQLKRRKEIYETLYPNSTPEAIRDNNLNYQPTARQIGGPLKTVTFVNDTNKSTGISERTLQRYIQIGSSISKEIAEIIKGTLIEDKMSDLEALSRIESVEKQKELIEKVKTGQAQNIRAAIKLDNPTPPKTIDLTKTTVPTKAYKILLEKFNDLELKFYRLEADHEQLKHKLQLE